jgi:hypothetical protein
MKSFTEYLTESKKAYPFKIAIAGELPDGFNDHLKTCLERFKVSNITTGKKTPIQERPLDFPNLHNMEVTHFEAELTYPTTAQVLGEYLDSCCDCPAGHIVVRGEGDPLEDAQGTPVPDTYEVKLTQEDMGGESAQESVAGDRVMDLLKELEVARKEREHDPAAAAPVGESSDIKNEENATSVVGGK